MPRVLQSITALFATTEAVMVAAMTSGRILTFIGDVSRTSNALKSIQASREGRDVLLKKDVLT